MIQILSNCIISEQRKNRKLKNITKLKKKIEEIKITTNSGSIKQDRKKVY